MKIQKICIFAYATEGEALEVANNTVEDTGIAEIRIVKGLQPAEQPVAWIVLRDSVIEQMAPSK